MTTGNGPGRDVDGGEEKAGEAGSGGSSGRKAWVPGLMALLALGAGAVGLARGAGDDESPADRTALRSHAAEMRGDSEVPGERVDAWLAVAREALASPDAVTLPFRDIRRLSEDEPAAGYRFRLRRGQAVEARVEAMEEEATDAPRDARSFVELYRVRPGGSGEAAFVAEADSANVPLVHEARFDGEFVLRAVSAPGRGGRYAVELAARAALSFPVAGQGASAVISRYGAPRDGGRRSHEGVDVIAPAGTPVLAVTKALVLDVGTSERGGNYVWLQDWSRRREIYYAHLDRSWVETGMVVEPGQEIGTVGNTGNASSTAPHLHFGIYDLDRRPSDPLPYIAPPEAVRAASSDSDG